MVSWSSGLSLCKGHVRASTASVSARRYVPALHLTKFTSYPVQGEASLAPFHLAGFADLYRCTSEKSSETAQ